ncbi:electron transfer flavoprotein subunit alpha [Hahella sp. CCB-MM4]|uniref:electron transfer flavoprotein subunit alpha n=1 Tax=Hahella sp. (strain CCB-MM4) TaxID=1926491 RepID=UPI000B9B6B63|nr:electron transfer flavoprotein subunit alpha/FixB family protein [Hahella sp. CCB-MM4]OZG70077.1 electron transfer flavoprotein subunit alpha [Hahella sp. CCB-MM4]
MSSLIRRDPRIERIARNRLHPLHQSLVGGSTEQRGPTGLLRKDPRAGYFMGPNGLKRKDRTGNNAPGAARLQRGASGATASEPLLPLHKVESPAHFIVCVLDMVGGRLTSHDKDVLGQAHLLAKSASSEAAVVAVVFGDHREEGFDKAGVDRLIHFNGDDTLSYQGYCPELKLAALQSVESALSPLYWLFPDSIHGGTDLGCRLSARIGERPANHAWQVDKDNTVCRGGSDRIDIRRNTPRLILLAEECAMPIDETRHEVLSLEIELITQAESRIQDLGAVDVDPSQIPLAEAEFILSAGNGVRDWDQFHEVATSLGATEGASRVAVDDGFMPRFRQVGATGTWVTARVYIAVGISGAIQHLQGIGQCEKVVAINTDPGCDMVKRADLTVIGRSQDILGELLQLYKARQTGSSTLSQTKEPDSVSNQEKQDKEARCVA